MRPRDAYHKRLGAMNGILDIIKEVVREEGSINAAARAMKMPQATLHNILNGAEPTLATLELIAAYRRMPLWKLLREAQRARPAGRP